MGAVLLPKAFLPEDEIAKQNNKNPITGTKLQNNNDDVNTNIDENLEEEFVSQKQANYFYAQANKKGEEGKKWKKMADEFSSKTDFSKLKQESKLKKFIDEIMLEEEIIGGHNKNVK